MIRSSRLYQSFARRRAVIFGFAGLALGPAPSARGPEAGCLPIVARGGFGGFSLTRLMRSSLPATRTFCNSLNIGFGMPSGKST
jgi:hypothetical protein